MIKGFWRKKKKEKNVSYYGVIVPNKYIISGEFEYSEKEQKLIRNWYLKNTPNKCQEINNYGSNWIGHRFGVRYYSGMLCELGFYRLCLGKRIYVILYDNSLKLVNKMSKI